MMSSNFKEGIFSPLFDCTCQFLFICVNQIGKEYTWRFFTGPQTSAETAADKTIGQMA
jgi:hypothetical protein